ncbi:nucleotide excision repair endonuclease [Enterococcus saigonensis]|uniref:Nucleotide excision repair endonuclease n=1 Tax=Enterococcus saigonensis TaxID=1805431 RepID=A0A679I8V0_9ENTE|nr:GIY-YIG nuclease family protein [Enterococcus saigonensis]BCA84820.1 nucleotide excision repair endonuclease [Enterococcus saigonensis]
MTLQDKLQHLPETPGIYLMKDIHGDILYVGKAKNLKRRVRSYFQKNQQHSKKVQRMVFNIADLEIQPVDTELDALLLECRLIQKIHPHYNRVMNYYQNYCYVDFTESGPVLTKSPTTTSVGPFRQYKQLPEIVALLSETYLLPKVNNVTKKMIQQQLPAVEHYSLTERLANCHAFFAGKKTTFFNLLKERIAYSAKQQNFEHAQLIKEQLELCQRLYHYIQQRNKFCQKKQLTLKLPLSENYQKIYFIAYGSIVKTIIQKDDTAVIFPTEKFSLSPLQKEDVDPLDILRSYYTRYHKVTPSDEAI